MEDSRSDGSAARDVITFSGISHPRKHGRSEERGALAGTHKTYLDPSGKVQVETYEVPGMSHGVAVDPKGGCGKAGAFVLDTGLCSSKLAADFFGI